MPSNRVDGVLVEDTAHEVLVCDVARNEGEARVVEERLELTHAGTCIQLVQHHDPVLCDVAR